MRLRNITGSKEMIAENPYVEHAPEMWKGKWSAERFGRPAPLHLEIGCGKGRFLNTMAELHPDINYIGIEKYSTVLLKAVKKTEEAPLSNICFLRMDAEYITQVFAPGEVERIYLNFSDPWPKDRHAKRRLPSRQFLARYDSLLTPEGRVEFKTDNQDLFDFALEETEAAGWHLDAVTRDLHNHAEMMVGNVMTEYEEKFSSKGNPICKMIISRSRH